jgi:hypothetical protein
MRDGFTSPCLSTPCIVIGLAISPDEVVALKEGKAMAKLIRLSVLAAAIFCSTAILIAQEQANAPVHKEGDTWQFNISRKGEISSSTDQNEGMYELSVTQGVVKLYAINGGQRNEIPIQPYGPTHGPTQGLLRLVGKGDNRPDLKFPLSVGQTWTYQYETKLASLTQPQRRTVDVNVAGMEQVTTPAGSFKAYKLIRTERWSMTSRGGFSGRNSITVTYFYSPETRSLVKSSLVGNDNPGTVEIELLKFTPGN